MQFFHFETMALMAALAVSSLSAAAQRPAGQPPARSAAASTDPVNPTKGTGRTNQADQAWQGLLKASEPAPRPSGWQVTPPSEAEIQKYNQTNAGLAKIAAAKANEFYSRFPEHSKAKEARIRELLLLNALFQLDDLSQMSRLETVEKNLWEDASFNEDIRLQVLANALQRAPFVPRTEAGFSADLTRLEQGALKLQKEYPRRLELFENLLKVASYRLHNDEVEKARLMLTAMTNSPAATEKVQEIARFELKKFDLLGKSLKLKFTAFDGREVDLEKMRGKVVMIDFWATWCGPCLAAIPKVKTAYDKFRPKGFEIVGINLDSDPARVTQLVESSKLTWPHHFDGQGYENQFAQDFGVPSIPTMWLVDRKGILRELSADRGLEQKIERLLAENP